MKQREINAAAAKAQKRYEKAVKKSGLSAEHFGQAALMMLTTLIEAQEEGTVYFESKTSVKQLMKLTTVLNHPSIPKWQIANVKIVQADDWLRITKQRMKEQGKGPLQ